MAKGGAGRQEIWLSVLLDPEDMVRERAISLKRSRSSHLNTLTTVQKEIEALLTVPLNVTLGKGKLDHFETLWNGFVDSDSKHLEVASTDKSIQISKKIPTLSQQRIDLSAIVTESVCSRA